jgi:regulator of RNase E activity RraA
MTPGVRLRTAFWPPVLMEPMVKLWNSDKELFAMARRELFPALVGDVLDRHGLLHQFLPPEIKPIDPHMVIVGRAMTVLESDVPSAAGEVAAGQMPAFGKSFGVMFEALDDLREDEVYVCSGASWSFALWGGLMSIRALHLKAAGAVVNGYSRDTPEILRLKFPVASAGGYAQDQGPRGKVLGYRVPIRFGDVLVQPGDIVFGDRDGVLIVPRSVEVEVFAGAFEKARGERKVLEALQGGMSTVDAFEKFGIM